MRIENFICFILIVLILLTSICLIFSIHIESLNQAAQVSNAVVKIDFIEPMTMSTAPTPIVLEKEIIIPDPLVIPLTYEEKEILAKLLYREAGSMSWEGQVWVCSAIINLGKHSNKSIWQMAHNANMFSVAPIVDSAKPKQMQYEVIDYIQHHGTIPEVKYFRINHYHTFWGAKPVRRIGNVYFSK